MPENAPDLDFGCHEKYRMRITRMPPGIPVQHISVLYFALCPKPKGLKAIFRHRN